MCLVSRSSIRSVEWSVGQMFRVCVLNVSEINCFLNTNNSFLREIGTEKKIVDRAGKFPKKKRCFWEGQGDGIVSDRSRFIGNSGFSDSHRWVYFFSGSSHRWMDGLRLLVLMPPILSIELSEAVFIET